MSATSAENAGIDIDSRKEGRAGLPGKEKSPEHTGYINLGYRFQKPSSLLCVPWAGRRHSPKKAHVGLVSVFALFRKQFIGEDHQKTGLNL